MGEIRDVDRLLDALEGMVYQFAYDASPKDGVPRIHTGGLSALEEAFDVLGWRDPHPIPASKCDEPGCAERNTCGWPSSTGYRNTCYDHMPKP